MFKNEIPTPAFEKNEEIKSFYENNKEIIEKLLEEAINKIGEGSTASVYFLGSNEEVCLKILKQDKDITADFHNSVETEVDIMNILKNKLREEVKIPTAYITAEYYKKEEDEKSTKFILMERIDGYSIRDIFEGKGNFPPNFDVESSMNELLMYLEKMHDENIYHRDLSPANIMINKVTGKLYIIDFGAATHSFGEVNPYIQERGHKNPVMYTEDRANIIDMFKSIRLHLLTNRK